MKLLLVADLHYTLRQWDWLTANAPRFDLVIIAGDLLDIASRVPLEAQVIVVLKYLERIHASTPLLVCSGNHDLVPPGEESEAAAAWLRAGRDARFRTDGDRWVGEGLCVSILPWWENPAMRQGIDRQLAADEPGERRWIWVCHAPPAESEVAWDGSRDFGDPQVRKWIRQFNPWLVLGGHVHNAPFVEGGAWIDHVDRTIVINGGRLPGPLPTFTVIDTDEATARWISAEAAEKATLSIPPRREPLEG